MSHPTPPYPMNTTGAPQGFNVSARCAHTCYIGTTTQHELDYDQPILHFVFEGASLAPDNATKAVKELETASGLLARPWMRSAGQEYGTEAGVTVKAQYRYEHDTAKMLKELIKGKHLAVQDTDREGAVAWRTVTVYAFLEGEADMCPKFAVVDGTQRLCSPQPAA